MLSNGLQLPLILHVSDLEPMHAKDCQTCLLDVIRDCALFGIPGATAA